MWVGCRVKSGEGVGLIVGLFVVVRVVVGVWRG